MHLHHLNCGSMYPYFPRIECIVYCLLVETDDGLLLVDTGFGVQDYTRPSRLMRVFTALLRTPRDLDETAVHQVTRLGYAVEDVHHIVCTHLPLDHAGGLPDFPNAHVHVYTPEYLAAMHPRSFVERFYDASHWAHKPKWVLYETSGESWFGFDSISVVEGLKPTVLLVPLVGHTRGHCGVAVETENGWLLHCGDAAYPFYHSDAPRNYMTDPPRWLERGLLGPNVPRLHSLLRDHRDEVKLVTSHDAYGFSKAKIGDTVVSQPKSN